MKKRNETNRMGIIGLGRVGLPVSEAYLKAGFEVYGYDVRQEAMHMLVSSGGLSMSSPRELATSCPIVILLVLNDKQVIEAISGQEGILQGMPPGGIIICMSTINRNNLEKMAVHCREKEIELIDCPFTGGPARIPDANLTLIAAAPEELLIKVTPILQVIGHITVAGHHPGQAQAVKHCNQLLVGITHSAVMEVITLAKALDLDPELVCRVAGKGIAGSDYFRLLSESVLHGTPSPGGLGQMCKDVAIVMNTARVVHFNAQTAGAAARYFSDAEKMDMQGEEGSALIHVVEKYVH